MKTKAFFLTGTLIFSMSIVQSQVSEISHELDETTVIPPHFCLTDKWVQGKHYQNIDEFLNENIVYPAQSARCNYQGTELVKFTVTTKGELTDFEVINSVCKNMDKEVIDVLKLTSGMWQPASINGKPVAMEKEVSVVFLLNASNNFVKMAKIHIKRGNRLLFEKNNPVKALRHYNNGLNLLPNNETLLAAHGLCLYEMGDENGANRDWERLKTIAGKKEPLKTEQLANNYNALSGYSKMMETLHK